MDDQRELAQKMRVAKNRPRRRGKIEKVSASAQTAWQDGNDGAGIPSASKKPKRWKQENSPISKPRNKVE